MNSMPPDAIHEQGRMQGFVASLLRHEGALVEPIEPEGLEVLAPSPVRQALGIGELSVLGFGTTLPPAAQRVGIEGNWLDRCGRLLGSRGRWTRRVLPAPARTPGDPERVLDHELILDNATFRLLGVAPAWTRYLVLDFRASAVSDDKRDFMLLRIWASILATGDTAAGRDVGGRSRPRSIDPSSGASEGWSRCRRMNADGLPAIWDRRAAAGRLVARALPRLWLDAALGPFVKGMRRRLGRDQERLHLYHNDLHREAVALTRSRRPEGDPKRRREQQRAEAIAREYRARLDDLARQYATRVTVEWVRTMELTMPVQRFAVQIRRRKADRVIRPGLESRFARRLEPPTCELPASTERPTPGLRRDALHLQRSPPPLAPCSACARAFCRACNPTRCPRCGTTGRFGVGATGAMQS